MISRIRIRLLLMIALVLAACAAPATPVPAGTPTGSGITPISTATLPRPGDSPIPATGAIAGHLSYPSEVIPELRVTAFSAADVSVFRYVDTVPNQANYQIDGLQPGRYHVVAYVLDLVNQHAGGYTRMVPCGLLSTCTDHALLDVEVLPGKTTGDVDPADWYAPEGTFPPMPKP